MCTRSSRRSLQQPRRRQTARRVRPLPPRPSTPARHAATRRRHIPWSSPRRCSSSMVQTTHG
eukprot:6982489-Prymnesium_polylepis.1